MTQLEYSSPGLLIYSSFPLQRKKKEKKTKKERNEPPASKLKRALDMKFAAKCQMNNKKPACQLFCSGVCLPRCWQKFTGDRGKKFCWGEKKKKKKKVFCNPRRKIIAILRQMLQHWWRSTVCWTSALSVSVFFVVILEIKRQKQFKYLFEICSAFLDASKN